MLNSAQLAAELGRPKQWITNNAKAGVIPGYRAPGTRSRWLFDLEEVKRALSTARDEPRPRKRRAS